MSKIRQIDYTTPRTLVSYSGKRTVRMTGQENRYKFSGVFIAGEEDEFAKIFVGPEFESEGAELRVIRSLDLHGLFLIFRVDSLGGGRGNL